MSKVDEAFDIDLTGIFAEPEPPAFTLEFTAERGRRAWPGLPYVAWMDHDGDFSWNSNNYVHGPMARIKPRK